MKAVFLGEKFGTDLHLKRWGRGLSMRQVSRLVSISDVSIAYYENAKVVPVLANFWGLCQEFELNPSDYFSFEAIEKGGK